MLLNVSDVLTSEGKVKSFSVPLELTGFNSRMGHFKVLEKTPVELTISNTGTGRARVEGSAVITFKQDVTVVWQMCRPSCRWSLKGISSPQM